MCVRACVRGQNSGWGRGSTTFWCCVFNSLPQFSQLHLFLVVRGISDNFAGVYHVIEHKNDVDAVKPVDFIPVVQEFENLNVLFCGVVWCGVVWCDETTIPAMAAIQQCHQR